MKLMKIEFVRESIAVSSLFVLYNLELLQQLICSMQSSELDFDVIIVGAGISGLASLHYIRAAAPGLRVVLSVPLIG